MVAYTKRERTTVIGLLAIAALERIAWAVLRPGNGASGEAANVAVSIATNGVFGDAYTIGQGPTAHLMPTTPVIAGAIYSVFGVRSQASEITLTIWCLALVLGAFITLYRTFARLGLPVVPRLLALSLLCIAPIYTAQESVDFRIWEGGLTVLISSVFLLLILDVEGSEPSFFNVCRLALVSAALFFTNPTMGIGAYICCALYAFHRLTWPMICAAALLATVTLGVLVAPWTLRNDDVMGKPILLRSNFGLELAVANHNGALSTVDQATAFHARLIAIHPAQSIEAYSALKQAGGEVAYSEKMKNEAFAWISANPASFASLSLRHIRQFFMPEPWMFGISPNAKLPIERSMVASLIGALGLLGAIWGLFDPLRRYPAVMLLTTGLLMFSFQPVLRYCYLGYGLLIFFASDFTWRIAQRCSILMQARRISSSKD